MDIREYLKKHWEHWSLRSRILMIMLSIAVFVLTVSTAGFAVGALRMQNLVSQYTQQMTQDIGGAVKSAFYQQNMCIYSGIVQAQAAYLEQVLRTDRETQLGSHLLELAEQYFYDTFPEVWSEEGNTFLWMDGQLVMDVNRDVQPIMESLVKEFEGNAKAGDESTAETDVTIQDLLTELPQGRVYTSGEQGYFLLWETFCEEYRIGMLMPASNSYDLTVALTGMLANESQIASEGIRSALVSSGLLVLAVVLGLVILIPPAAGKLARIITTPVEQEQVRREHELMLAEEENRMLEELDRKKTEFLANISHELKTPLTVVSNYAQASVQGLTELPEAKKEVRAMRMIVTEVNRMAMLVNQLLDVTRIDAGRLVLNRKSIQIDELIKRTLDTYVLILQKNNNQLVFHRMYDLPEMEVDEVRMQEVLVNLLSNAAKHTHNGTVTVDMAQREQYVEISVSDTGEGIPAEQLPHIFERFYTNKSCTDAKTSTGLGLYLCKSFVEAHGGTIWVESIPGVGTTVHFTLPANISPHLISRQI